MGFLVTKKNKNLTKKNKNIVILYDIMLLSSMLSCGDNRFPKVVDGIMKKYFII